MVAAVHGQGQPLGVGLCLCEAFTYVDRRRGLDGRSSARRLRTLGRAASKMVIKTEQCTFSSFKIFPGHGMMHVDKGGRTFRFINAKNASLWHQGKKAQKLTWTQTWRKMHKKGLSTLKSKKRRVARSSSCYVSILIGRSQFLCAPNYRVLSPPLHDILTVLAVRCGRGCVLWC